MAITWPISRDSSAVEQLIRNQQVVGSIPILGSATNTTHLIVSKPIQSTLLAFIGFILLGILLIGMGLVQIINNKEAPWHSYLTVLVLAPLCLFLLHKVIFNYKVLTFGPKITIHYPVRKSTKTYSPNQVESWGEAVVKTGKTSTFKELEIRFENHDRINLGHREYANYDRVVGYLKKNAGNKEQLFS